MALALEKACFTSVFLRGSPAALGKGRKNEDEL